MTVIWGVNATTVPQRLDRDSIDYKVIAQYENHLSGLKDSDNIIYCWVVDEKYIPVVYMPKQNVLIACAEYKYFSGFTKWLERFYPMAYRVSHYEPSRRDFK